MHSVIGVFDKTGDAEGARAHIREAIGGETNITLVKPARGSEGGPPGESPAVLVAFIHDAEQAEAANHIVWLFGGETLESARETWWANRRGAEEEHYHALGFNFREDELTYKRGFQAALQPGIQGTPYINALDYLRKHYPDVSEQSFRHGYERGFAYYHAAREKYRK